MAQLLIQKIEQAPDIRLRQGRHIQTRSPRLESMKMFRRLNGAGE
jgi:hypothetical protein